MKGSTLADFDVAITWEERADDAGGFIPSRAEVIAMDHVRRVCAGATPRPLPAPMVVDERFTFTHVVRSKSGGGAFLLGGAATLSAG